MPLTLIPPGRRKNNRFWLIRGTVKGRSVEVSSKTTNKRAAERLAVELEAELLKTTVERATATVRQAADLYLAYREPRKADRQMIERIVAVYGGRLLSSIRQHDIVALAELLYPGRANETKNRHVFGPLAAILHYAAENDLCPYLRVRKLRERRPPPRALSREAGEALIRTAEGPLKTLLIFLFRQGWRISDTLRLRWDDVDLRRRVARYRISKTDDWKIAPLHDEVMARFRVEPRFGPFVFPWRDKSPVYKALAPLRKATGIAFTPHQARHSFATWLVEAGAEMTDLMEAGGWKDPKSVARYARPGRDRIRAMINRVGTRRRGKTGDVS